MMFENQQRSLWVLGNVLARISTLALIARVKAEGLRLSDTAALYQALGGGWWHRDDAGAAGSCCGIIP